MTDSPHNIPLSNVSEREPPESLPNSHPALYDVYIEDDCAEIARPSVGEKAGSMQFRTSRVHLAISVFVYGNTVSGEPFKEITSTVTINANGCLLHLETPVAKDQQLLLANMKSNQEMACMVVSVRKGPSDITEVALRFCEPAPRFWGLAFPPEDWDPAQRKRAGR